MVADLQIEAEEANGGVLLTVVDSARLTMLLTRETAAELLDAIDACMKTGERQTTRAVDVWRAAPDLPVFGVHVSIDGASWTCGAVRGWDVDGLADGVTFSPACRGGGFLLKNPSGFSIDRLSPHALWFARFMSRATR